MFPCLCKCVLGEVPGYMECSCYNVLGGRFNTANKGLKIPTLFGGLPVTFQDKVRIILLWAGVNTVGKMGLKS